MPPIDPPANPPPTPAWRKLLIQAKEQGASDLVAAHFAGLTEDDLDEKLAGDPTLDRDMRQGRAKALIAHLESIGKASQWQAHEYLLESLWPDQFGDTPPPQPETKQKQEIRQAVESLTPSETRALPAIIRAGADLLRRPLEGLATGRAETSPCPTAQTTPLPP